MTPSASDAINLPETTASGETDAPEADRRNSPVDPRPVFETPRLVALRTVDPAALVAPSLWKSVHGSFGTW